MEFGLFGFRVRVEITFLIIAVLFGLSGQSGLTGQTQWLFLAVWVGIMFFGVLAHELGHAFAFKLYGFDSHIVLHGMGGVTIPISDGKLTPWRHIVISVAGPAVGITIGVIVLVLQATVLHAPAGSVGAEVVESLVWVNLGWGVLNLLPMLPLDGGHVMSAVFDLFTKGNGMRPALFVSIAVAGLVGLLAISVGAVYGALLCALFIFGNIQALRASRQASRPDPSLHGRLQEARQLLEQGQAERAIAVAEALVRDARTSDMVAAGLQVVAYGHIAREDVAAAASAVKRFPNDKIPDLALQGILLLGEDRPEDAIAPLRSAFDRAPGRLTGLLLLEALCSSGRFESAVDFVVGPASRVIGDEGFRRVVPAAFEAEAFVDAARAGKAWFERAKIPEVAYNVACALARAGREGEAMEWLGRAVDAGFRDLPMLEKDGDLAPLRARPDYAELRARIERAATA